MVLESIREGIESAESGKEEDEAGEGEVEAIHRVEHEWRKEVYRRKKWLPILPAANIHEIWKSNIREVDAREF